MAPALLRWAKRHESRSLLLASVPAATGGILWIAWSRSVSGGVQETAELSAAYGGALTRLPAVAFDNARELLTALGGSHLPPSLGYGPFALALGVALAAVAALGLRRRRADPGSLALLGAVAMHLVWPWHYERYLIPLLPLVWAAVASGLGRRAKAVLGALLAAQLAFQVAPRLGRAGPWAEPELARAYAWLSAVPGPWLLVSAAPLRDGWWTARPAVSFPDAPDAATFAARLKEGRARFILRQDGLDLAVSDAGRAADPLRAAAAHLDDKRLFRLVAEFPEERAKVYELR